jgi:phage terminase large subunit
MELKLQATPIFERNFDSDKRIVVNRGGTRSSKTVSIMQLAILFLFTGYVKPKLQVSKGVWSTVRKFSNNLDKTVIRDFEEQLLSLGIMDLVKRNKTAKTYTYGQRMVEFFGADEEQKIRGAKRVVLHCNEGNEIDFNDWYQLIFRTEERAYIDFNPDDENIWINKEIEQKRQFDKGDVEVIVSTYQDNTFLPQTLIDEIEYLKDTDLDFWKIFGLGEYGSIKGLIFESWDVRTLPHDAVLLGYALDFGFTNDPTAIPAIYKSGGELWFKEMLYERRLTNRDISDQMNILGINKSNEIIADSAEPKSIEEIYRLGWNIHAAKKGPDSIKNSIDILKRFVCHITPESVNLIKEHKTYKWKEDKNGNYLNEPVDFNNHLLDGIRYFALNKLRIDHTGQTKSHLPFKFTPPVNPDLEFMR